MTAPIRCLATAIPILALPASAQALEIHQHSTVGEHLPGPPIEVMRVVHVAPADSDDDGLANRKDDCPKEAATTGNGCPPEPAPVASSSSDYVAPAPVTYGTTTSGGCPSYMAAEADSPSDVNPTSGASGCYQVLPSTAANYGAACADVNADSCVAAICASEGPGAWAASGANPCPYVQP
jgi:hypothetical protein